MGDGAREDLEAVHVGGGVGAIGGVREDPGLASLGGERVASTLLLLVDATASVAAPARRNTSRSNADQERLVLRERGDVAGQAMGLKVEEVRHDASHFQDIFVFRSSTYGTVLVLDGVIR